MNPRHRRIARQRRKGTWAVLHVGDVEIPISHVEYRETPPLRAPQKIALLEALRGARYDPPIDVEAILAPKLPARHSAIPRRAIRGKK